MYKRQDQQIAINLAKSGGIGLAEVITRQLTLGRTDAADAGINSDSVETGAMEAASDLGARPNEELGN